MTTTTEIDESSKHLFNNPQIEALDREIQSCFMEQGGKFFILFDNLDDDYDLNPQFTATMVDSLINAGIQIMRQSRFVRPIIFIRNDILSYIANSKNSAVAQMRSNKVELTWTERKLLSVLNSRFSNYFYQSKPEKGEESHPSKYLKRVFPTNYIYYGSGGVKKIKPIGFYITERSLLRPREILQFCRKMIEVNDYKIPLTNRDIQESEPRYVAEFMDDLCAEYKNLYPNLRDVLELFRKGRHERDTVGWNWTVSDLKRLFESNTYLNNHRHEALSFGDSVNALFKVGFLRAVSKTKRPGKHEERRYISSTEEPDFPTDNVDEFDVHRVFRSQLKLEKRT